jgi:Holliday junction DNA helicase RuvA
MIGYLSGTVRAIGGNYAIIEVNGVGYRVTIAEKMKLIISNIGSKVNIFTHFMMNPRDGSVELFGFQDERELQFFEILTTVSGIGPKTAQGILANTDVITLQMGILNGDSVTLSKMSGIGAKTAQRLILELKSKMEHLPLTDAQSATMKLDSEALDALVSLGYSRFEAHDALKQITDAISVEEKVTNALRILAKR